MIGNFFTGQAEPSSYLFAGILTFTTYTLAGTMREQVCTYMCPWPRIQAAMTDRDALNVTYRVDRGEPRGPHKKGESLGRPRRLHRLQAVRGGLSDGDRYS